MAARCVKPKASSRPAVIPAQFRYGILGAGTGWGGYLIGDGVRRGIHTFRTLFGSSP